MANTNALNSWNAEKQEQYRTQHAEKVLTFHLLLDASASMIGTNATNLRQSYNLYLAWLQHHADPMSLAEVRCFSTPLDLGGTRPLGTLKPLTEQTYDPLTHGSGTALYHAIGETCTHAMDDTTQHVLVVFTDGLDNTSDELGWTNGRVFTVLKTLQEHQGWLCVFLGAFRDALEVGKSMGFQPGNCLEFTTDKIPDAFQALQHATQKYLQAPPQDRKLLAAGGIF